MSQEVPEVVLRGIERGMMYKFDQKGWTVVKQDNSPRPEAYDLANLPNPPSSRPDPRDGMTSVERKLLKKEEPVYLGPTGRSQLSPRNALRRLDRYFAGAESEDVGEALEVLWEYVMNSKETA